MGDWDQWFGQLDGRLRSRSRTLISPKSLVRYAVIVCCVALVSFLLRRSLRLESMLPETTREKLVKESPPLPATPFSGVNETKRVADLMELDEDKRADQLRSAMVALGDKPMSREVALMLASCVPRDIADALLPTKSPAWQVAPLAVIDVGAGDGWPVTKLALQRNYDYVISLEPDPRNIERLLKNTVLEGSIFMPMTVAAGRSVGQQEMAFHKERTDFSCFTCLDTSGKRPEVYTEKVDVTTLDLTVHRNSTVPKDAPIQLLKLDVQGYEVEVLNGAMELLESGRVQYAVVEFDPRLLGREETSMELLSIFIEKADMECFHLRFSGRSDESIAAEPIPLFKHAPIPADWTKEFVAFVKAKGGWTFLFCKAKQAK